MRNARGQIALALPSLRENVAQRLATVIEGGMDLPSEREAEFVWAAEAVGHGAAHGVVLVGRQRAETSLGTPSESALSTAFRSSADGDLPAVGHGTI